MLGSGFLNDFSKSLSDELPTDLGDLQSHLSYIIPMVTPYGEDMAEFSFWQGKRWLEFREAATFHEKILHFFSPDGEYLLIVDGNVVKGTWKRLSNDNSIMLDIAGKTEFFDLAFLNADFFILNKHGKNTKFFTFVFEPQSFDKETKTALDWRQLMEKLYNVYRSDSGRFSSWVGFLLILVIAILIYSFG